MPLLRAQYTDAQLVFIDDGQVHGMVNGHAVFNWENFLCHRTSKKYVCLAISDSRIRQSLAEKTLTAGVPLVEARADNVVEMDNVLIREGACLSPFVTLTSNIRVGRCFHANLYSYVEHDCVIGDFVTLAPGAKVNGNVTIGDHAYIGSGVTIRQGLTIGASAIVGMGAVVIRDAPPDVTVVGNPAKLLLKD